MTKNVTVAGQQTKDSAGKIYAGIGSGAFAFLR
jgi:hypothetical protein